MQNKFEGKKKEKKRWLRQAVLLNVVGIIMTVLAGYLLAEAAQRFSSVESGLKGKKIT